MYLGIDIGGTKTLVATLNNEGVITKRLRVETPQQYSDFLRLLAKSVVNIPTDTFIACGVGVPGRIDRTRGIGIAMGNLSWKRVPIQADIKKIVRCPVVVENDANLAGLSEAMLTKDRYDRVLYITISTGIGTGIIINRAIDPSFADSEGGHILIEHQDKLQSWETVASGKAIVRRYGRKASAITDQQTWRHIARDLSVGLIDLIAVIQPQVIIFGGGVGTYFERLKEPLLERLKMYETPLVPIPHLVEAQRPEEAVLFGCYDLAKSIYGKAHTSA